MQGKFKDNFPQIEIELIGDRASKLVSVILDTGYDGGLAVPHSEEIANLGLELRGVSSGILADGSSSPCTTYVGKVLFGNKRIRVIVEVQSGGGHLLGLGLLRDMGCSLEVNPVSNTFILKEIRGPLEN